MIHPKQTHGLSDLYIAISGPKILQIRFLESYFQCKIPIYMQNQNILFYSSEIEILHHHPFNSTSIQHQKLSSILDEIRPDSTQSLISHPHLLPIYSQIEYKKLDKNCIFNVYLVDSNLIQYKTKIQEFLAIGTVQNAQIIQKLNYNKKVIHIQFFAQLLDEKIDIQRQKKLIHKNTTHNKKPHNYSNLVRYISIPLFFYCFLLQIKFKLVYQEQVFVVKGTPLFINYSLEGTVIFVCLFLMSFIF